MNPQQYEKVKSAKGFIAALDQSGGSTPKALSLYGIKPDAYSGDQQMFDLIHAMRTRIITSPAFNGDRILGAILFEQTMDREIEGRGSADYQVMLKVTIPSVDDFYADLVKHPKLVRVVALSGGYSRDEANTLLARNHGVVASFSRALTEGLTAQQSAQEFNRALDASIASIHQASVT